MNTLLLLLLGVIGALLLLFGLGMMKTTATSNNSSQSRKIHNLDLLRRWVLPASLIVGFLAWDTLANWFSAWFVSSDAGELLKQYYKLEEETVRGWLWLVVLTILAAVFFYRRAAWMRLYGLKSTAGSEAMSFLLPVAVVALFAFAFSLVMDDASTAATEVSNCQSDTWPGCAMQITFHNPEKPAHIRKDGACLIRDPGQLRNTAAKNGHVGEYLPILSQRERASGEPIHRVVYRLPPGRTREVHEGSPSSRIVTCPA